MEEDVDRMTRLIEQMLTLTRIEQRGLSDFTPVVLANLLVEIAAIFQPKANEHQIQLTLGLPSQTNLKIMGDVGPLRQLFTNLIENSLKYTPVGGQVTVQLAHNQQYALVSVIDSGEGIAPEHLPRLFDRFFRTDSARSRDTGGSGLGLAIAQAIVQAHNGMITVASEPGKGSIFTVSLPIQAA
jgi:signal transduction histidine kinase